MSFIETHTQLLLTLAWSLDYDTHQYLRKWLEPHLRLRLLKKDISEFITDSSKKFEFFCKRVEVEINLSYGLMERWGGQSNINLDALPQPMRFGLKNRIKGNYDLQGRVPDIRSPYTLWDIIDTDRDLKQYYIDGTTITVVSMPPWRYPPWGNGPRGGGVDEDDRGWFCIDHDKGNLRGVSFAHDETHISDGYKIYIRRIMDEEEIKIIS